MLLETIKLIKTLWPFFHEGILSNRTLKQWAKTHRLPLILLFFMSLLTAANLYLFSIVVTLNNLYQMSRKEIGQMRVEIHREKEDISRLRTEMTSILATKQEMEATMSINRERLDRYHRWFEQCRIDPNAQSDTMPPCQINAPRRRSSANRAREILTEGPR